MPPLRTALAAALLAVVSSCASTGGVPQPFPRVGSAVTAPLPAPVAAAPTPGAAVGYAVAGTALDLRGAPYRLGGADPGGFDCSGLVQYVFAQHAVGLPRTVDGQVTAGARVAPDAIEPGDLLFFATTGAREASHVGIAIGGDQFVHAPTAQGDVRVEHLTAPYWSSRFVEARRILASGNRESGNRQLESTHR